MSTLEKKQFPLKSLIIAALCIALGVVLPMAFHSIPEGGRIFSPMHIPVLLGGLVTGPILGLIIGILTPLLSHLVTGMPPTFVLPGMLVELAAFGLVAGLLMKTLPLKMVAKTYIALIIAMVVGRVLAGTAHALFFTDGYTFNAFFTAYFVRALPGIALHIVLIPLVYFALVKAKLAGD